MKINIKKKLKSAGSTIKGMGSIDKKSLKNGSYSMGITAIVIAVLVVINLIVGQIPEKYTQVDVSTQKLYTISDTTVKYLKDMNTDVTIYHIVQSGKEDSVLEKMLTRYEEESKHIKVEKKDPVLYPNFTSQYTSDDVADNSLIVVAGEKSKVSVTAICMKQKWIIQPTRPTLQGLTGKDRLTVRFLMSLPRICR